MQAKDLLLVAGGVALGYLIFKKDLFKRVEKATVDVSEGAIGTVSGGVSTLLEGTGGIRPSRETQTSCDKEWEEIASRTRFSSEEAMLNAKKEFITNCLLKK
jgi:hypothetical protein